MRETPSGHGAGRTLIDGDKRNRSRDCDRECGIPLIGRGRRHQMNGMIRRPEQVDPTTSTWEEKEAHRQQRCGSANQIGSMCFGAQNMDDAGPTDGERPGKHGT
jgi:hypothetical protein